MKTSKRFLLVFLLSVIVFSLLSAASAALGMSAIKTNTNSSVVQLISNLRSEYPDISDSEIAALLNGRENTSDTKKMLEKYGIYEDSWIIESNGYLSSTVIFACSCVCLLSGIFLCGIFAVYVGKRHREDIRLADYLSKINNGDYSLKIEENSEDENSLLKNEIYKTTVMLREQSENSLKDKELLKDSLSDISHQLKTPLTSIIIMLDNLLDDKNMPENIRLEFLADIKRSANNISFLVQSLLTLSKLDANSIEMHRNPESISAIFEECIQNTAVLADICEVSVISKCDELITVNCDFKWLCEAISNIVKNCIEHTASGGYVKLEAEGGKLFTKITISDNGSGIYPEDLPHIFKRFYKGRNSGETSIGIGLALAKTIIEKNGGCISVKSTVGSGTVFTIKYFNTQQCW